MLILLIFGLIGLLFPGWLMACCGLGARTEEEPCLVWMFRILGAVLTGAALWFIVARAVWR